MQVLARFCLAAFFIGGSSLTAAQISVPASASFQLNGGTIDLGGGDLQLSGAFDMGSGRVSDAANIFIGSSGSLSAGSGTVTLFGNWSNLGSFLAGNSTVNFVDGPLAQSVLTGATTFHAASFVSSTGKNYVFPVGLTQTFTTALTVLGTAASGIQFRSAAPGQAAVLNLLASGTQAIDYVGVSNVHAVGQVLAPTKTNDGGTGDALGWFATLGPTLATAAVPALTWIGVLLLAILLVGSAMPLRHTSLLRRTE